MARWKARRRDTAMLEARRREGMQLLADGRPAKEVARALGVSPAAVSHWRHRARAGGADALASVPRKGRPSQVSRAQRAELVRLIAKSPRSLGRASDHWTLGGIAQVLERAWGIRYSRANIWRLLHQHGFGWTRPPRTPRWADPRTPSPGWFLARRIRSRAR